MRRVLILQSCNPINLSSDNLLPLHHLHAVGVGNGKVVEDGGGDDRLAAVARAEGGGETQRRRGRGY